LDKRSSTHPQSPAGSTEDSAAPGPAAALASHSIEPIEMHTVRLHAVKVSSRALSWGPLNIERREEPRAGREFFPAGSTEHLIFVRLSDYYVRRESQGETTEGQYLAGQVSIHPAGIPIRWEWTSKLNFLLMTLAPVFLDNVARRAFGEAAAPVHLWHEDGRHDPLINNVAAALLREMLAADVGTSVFIESLATVLSVHLIRHYAEGRPAVPEPPAAHRAVSAAVRFIRENYAHEVALSDMAQAAGMSPFHLTRLFKKTMGMSPHQYLVEVRVHSALALLSAGAERPSLAEVAAAVGFSDQSHLTRQFKRILGTTPKKARL
jgi:AraC family transcriptional regulator